MIEYQDLERNLRREAETVARSGKEWSAAAVAGKLTETADQLALIRKQHMGGIDASMGKRSGIRLKP